MNKLKELRMKRQLNMREVAQKLNIPYTTYVNYEKGVREPNSEMLILLSDFFGVSVDYLIGRSNYTKIQDGEFINNSPANKDNASFPLQTQEQKHIEVYRKLNAEGKERVDTYTNDLAENPKYTTAQETKPLRLHTKQKEHDAAFQTIINEGGEEIVTIPIVARNGNTEPINMNRKELKELKKELDALFDDKNDENEIIPLDED